MEHREIQVLIVDDESAVRDSLKKWLEADGFSVETACDSAVALKRLESRRFDVLVIDIRMPGMSGMELQERLRPMDPAPIVIFMTAFAAVETAVTAMRGGAYDYISKPFEPEKLSRIIRNAVQERSIVQEAAPPRRKAEEPKGLGEILGESRQIREVVSMVKTVAEADVTVLIQGESGTGKELIARSIHGSSRRRNAPFIPIPCGALAGKSLEEELFGWANEAAQGSPGRWKGKLELAQSGTVFLDEVGLLSPKIQIDLLRILETKHFTPAGSGEQVPVDSRLICATNQDLRQSVAEGSFREDFYYRINVFTIVLPPLRERRSDIPLLAVHFLQRARRSLRKEIEGFSEEALQLLERHSWPGNVRELENAIEHAAVLSKGPRILPEDFSKLQWNGPVGPRDDSLEEVAREHILRVLEASDWNMTRAARTLKIDRVTLYNKVKKYGIERPSGK